MPESELTKNLQMKTSSRSISLTQLNIDEHNRIPTTDGRLIRRVYVMPEPEDIGERNHPYVAVCKKRGKKYLPMYRGGSGRDVQFCH